MITDESYPSRRPEPPLDPIRAQGVVGVGGALTPRWLESWGGMERAASSSRAALWLGAAAAARAQRKAVLAQCARSLRRQGARRRGRNDDAGLDEEPWKRLCGVDKGAAAGRARAGCGPWARRGGPGAAWTVAGQAPGAVRAGRAPHRARPPFRSAEPQARADSVRPGWAGPCGRAQSKDPARACAVEWRPCSAG